MPAKRCKHGLRTPKGEVLPRAGLRLGAAFAVTWGDPGGKVNVMKIHWHREAGGVTYDLPTEARFYPDTWGTAAFQ